MRRALPFIVGAAVACGVFLYVQKHQIAPPPGGGGGGGANAGAGIGAGAGAMTGGGDNPAPMATQEQVLPVEIARQASPIWEGHASWPVAEKLPAFPEKPTTEQQVAAAEVERDVEQWFSKDLRFTRGLDGAQPYLKGQNAAGSVTVLVARNRMKPKVYTLAFEAAFADAVPVDAENLLKRLKVVLSGEIYSEIEKRGVKQSPAVTGTSDFAGLVTFGQSGVGTVFPYLYAYGRPKQVVGVFQTIPSTYGAGEKPVPK